MVANRPTNTERLERFFEKHPEAAGFKTAASNIQNVIAVAQEVAANTLGSTNDRDVIAIAGLIVDYEGMLLEHQRAKK